MPDKFILNEFNIFRKDRNTKYGGVFIAIKNTYNCRLIPELMIETLEMIPVEVKIEKTLMLLITIYVPNKKKYFLGSSDDLKLLMKKLTNLSIYDVILITANELISDSLLISNEFSRKFQEIYNNNDSISNNFPVNKFNDIYFNLTDVLREINQINMKKSEGPAKISNHFMKLFRSKMSIILFDLFKKIIDAEIIPENLKISQSIPILKPGKDPHSFSSYRNVTVQNNILKLFDKLLFNNLSAYVFNNNILGTDQYAFIPGSSLQNMLIDMLKIIFEFLDDIKTQCVEIIIFDLSHAFDKLLRSIILKKLEKFGFGGKILKIINQLLINRKQFVKYNNQKSNVYEISSGVPQGGHCSPLLFNLYTADMHEIILFSILMKFADDNILIKRIVCIEDTEKLQKDIDSFVNYCRSNSLELNESKTIHLRVSKRNMSSFQSFGLYKVGDALINPVEECKFL
ncbi:DNA polymerase theta-like protein, partial [Dinothrombium tinctorium]